MINRPKPRRNPQPEQTEPQAQPQRIPRRNNRALRFLEFGRMNNNQALGKLQFKNFRDNRALAGLNFNIKSNVISQQKPKVTSVSQPFERNGLLVKLIQFSDGKKILVKA